MKIEKISSNRVKFLFDVTPAEFEHGLDHAFEHIKKDVDIKGFRKGHVTRKVFEDKVGVEALFEEALNHVFHHKYEEAYANKEYQIVGEPKIDLDFSKVKRGESFDFSFEVAVKPEVVLGAYKGIEVAKVDDKLAADAVDQAIDAMLKQNAILEPKEGKLEKGDTANFDFEGFVDSVPFEGGKAENYELVIGSGQFIPGFEDGMIGLATGEERDVNVTFPTNYQAENLAGKDAVFKVKLHEIKTSVAGKLDDEWVKSLNREGIETVDQLKQAELERLTKEKEESVKNQLLESALEKITADAKIDIPSEMVAHEVEQNKKNIENQAKQYGVDYDMYLSLSGLEKEVFESGLEKEAHKRILNSLVIEEIAKNEKVEVTEEQITAKYEEFASHYKMPVADIQKYIQRDMIENEVKFQLAIDFILNNLIQK